MERKNGAFRKRKESFAMVSNHILRDDSVSLRSKGLFALIQSYVTLENFTIYKSFLQSKCMEGEKAFNRAWEELKTAGYLVQYKLKDENNRFFYEYELLDVPEKKPYPQKGGVGNFDTPHPLFEGVEKEDVQNEGMRKGGYISNTLNNNIISNNTLSNQIISECDVMAQIEYIPEMKDDFIENLVVLMVDVLNLPDDTIIRVNQCNQKAKIVKERFRKIRSKHIEYVKLVFAEFTGEINDLRSYLITTLYNAVSTCDIYFSQRVKHDLYGEEEHQWKIVK